MGKILINTSASHCILVCLTLLLSCSTMDSKLDQDQTVTPPFGNWYAPNRHMNVRQNVNVLIDTTTWNQKDFTDKYQIHSIIKKRNDSYLIKLTQEGKTNPMISRYFIMDASQLSMREFNGDRVISWSRSP